ncbi:Uncharacterised protein [Staphylococcus aureus]|nr:Uncharacterised protein [Staphylococcus aureus]
MKRLLGLLLVSTLVLSACGNDENQEESKKEVKSKEKKIEKEKENKSKKDKEKEVATLVCQQFFRQFSCVDF